VFVSYNFRSLVSFMFTCTAFFRLFQEDRIKNELKEPLVGQEQQREDTSPSSNNDTQNGIGASQ
jgi:hypothetical protein